MKLDETTLIEIQDYINALDEKVGLKPETVEDVRKAIDKHRTELKNFRLVAVSGRSELLKCQCKKAKFTRTVDADFNPLCGRCGKVL